MTAPVPPRAKRRPPWWLWVLAAAASLVGVVALLGGFNEVAVAKLPQVQLGEAYVGNEVALQVDDIYLSRTEPVTGDDAPENQVYLVVETTAENTTAQPSIFLDNALRVLVEGAIGSTDPPYDVVDLDSGDRVSFLQPALPVRAGFLWEIRDGQLEPGDEIFLGIFERYAVPDDPRFDDYRSTPEAVVRLAETIGDFR